MPMSAVLDNQALVEARADDTDETHWSTVDDFDKRIRSRFA